MQKSSKEQELRWLRSCQEKCLAFPRSEPMESETPDFIFQEADLGVEITEYIQDQGAKGSPVRQRESFQDNIVKEAQRHFEATHKEQLHVSVFWPPSMQHVKPESEFLIRGIVQTVTMLLAQGRGCWRPDLTQVDEIKLGQYIGQICLYRLNRSPSYWSCNEAGAIGHDVIRVQTVISHKDQKVSEYRKKCRHLWLLIVADNKHLSSIFSPDEDFDSATFQTSFDRVFILDVFGNRVLEVRVKPCSERKG